MAKKKRQPGGKGPKKRPQLPPLEKLPDFRAMEGMMQQQVAKLEGRTDQDTPLGKAQALMYRAFDEPQEQNRIKLAKESLEICPDCADAYVLLAEHAKSRKEALHLYEQGVAAGERALGPEAIQQHTGHFWLVLETRPYMRARLGLAHSLWTAGRREEAVQHLQDMLRLNPGDNQGIRYTLAGFLLFLDRDEDLGKLLQEYDEPSATWAYTKALLSFRQQGDTPEAQKMLQEASKRNKHVPAYLLGEKFPPSREPSYYSPGDESEALEYIGSFMASWKSTPGAIAWLRQMTKAKKRKASPAPKGPLGLIKKWLNKNLSQNYDEWQVDFRQMPNWINIDGKMVRPWTLLVISRSNDLALAHQIFEDVPSAGFLWDTLVQAMQNPGAGEPHRPTELQVRADSRWAELKPHLDEIGVDLVVKDDLDHLGEMFQAMIEHVCGKQQPGLLDMPGVTPEQVGRFYEAAAYFFQQAPWKKVGYEAAIQIECDKFQSGPWYAVLMGQSGLTMGLALYEDLVALKQVFTSDGADEDTARQSVATTVTFGEEWTIPVADLDAAKKYGWQVARPDAYPEIFHKERGLSVRPPLAWELELLEACLRAVPDFVNRKGQDDPTKVEFSAGDFTLVLSWVVDS